MFSGERYITNKTLLPANELTNCPINNEAWKRPTAFIVTGWQSLRNFCVARKTHINPVNVLSTIKRITLIHRACHLPTVSINQTRCLWMSRLFFALSFGCLARYKQAVFVARKEWFSLHIQLTHAHKCKSDFILLFFFFLLLPNKARKNKKSGENSNEHVT